VRPGEILLACHEIIYCHRGAVGNEGTTMATRREFAQWGMASTVMLSATPAIGTAATAGRPSRPATAFHTVLFDPRFESSRRFAAEMQRLGTPVRASGANVTDLWSGQLRPAWQAGATTLAGMTVFPAYFALKTIARDAGLRVMLCAEHCNVDTRLVHRFSAARGVLPQAGQIFAAGDDWPTHMARLVLSLPLRSSPLLQREFRTPHTTSFAATETLVSFVLARADRSGRRAT
jgi:hypothetical protein